MLKHRKTVCSITFMSSTYDAEVRSVYAIGIMIIHTAFMKFLKWTTKNTQINGVHNFDLNEHILISM